TPPDGLKIVPSLLKTSPLPFTHAWASITRPFAAPTRWDEASNTYLPRMRGRPIPYGNCFNSTFFGLKSPKPNTREETFMTMSHVTRCIEILVGLCIAASAMPLHAAKQCYAPDARSQERAFSRAVTTEGGKMIWLGGQTASLPPAADFDTQVR